MRQSVHHSGVKRKSKIYIVFVFIILVILGVSIAQIMGVDTKKEKDVSSQKLPGNTQTGRNVSQPQFSGEITFTP